jgi:hypothetical protein
MSRIERRLWMKNLNHKLRFKYLGIWSAREKKLRICKWTWATGKNPRVDGWHSSSFRISLWPKIFHFSSEYGGWAITIIGIRFHRKKAYGGWL